LRNDADVIVIGGGIMGAATALDIVRRSKLSVILLERSMCGSQASSSNYGNVRFYDWLPEQMAMAIRARAIWSNLESLVGSSCEWNMHGALRVAFSEKDFVGLQNYAATATGYDFKFELYDRNEVRRRFPWLNGSAGAMFSPLDGTVNPRFATAAFARAAAAAGVRIHEHTEAQHARLKNDTFVVRVADGRVFSSGVLVNCAGAWGGRVADWFGEGAPVTPMSPQLMVTEPVRPFSKPHISCMSPIYFRQTPRGNLLIGGGLRGFADVQSNRHHFEPFNLGSIYREFLKVVPRLRGIRVIRAWSGFEGYTADLRAIIGMSPTVSGFFHCFAFNGAGLQQGPALGEIMSELVRTGRSTTNLREFGLQRFANPDLTKDQTTVSHTTYVPIERALAAAKA
jgi:sarcosine oxidase, subunit beta